MIVTNTAARPHALRHSILVCEGVSLVLKAGSSPVPLRHSILVCEGVSLVLRAASSSVSLIALAWTSGFVVDIVYFIWIFGRIGHTRVRYVS